MMTTIQHIFLTSGALFGFLGVAAGAFAAHLLKSKMPVESFNIFEIAVRYQMYHALVLIALTALLGFMHSTWLTVAGSFFIVGVLIFSGSLYAFVLTGIRFWGVMTPVGGLCLILGWLSLLLAGVLGRS